MGVVREAMGAANAVRSVTQKKERKNIYLTYSILDLLDFLICNNHHKMNDKIKIIYMVLLYLISDLKGKTEHVTCSRTMI